MKKTSTGAYWLFGLACWAWINIPGAAQTLHIDAGQRLYIAENALVVLGGGLHNQGTLIQRGSVQVFDHWINEGTYAAGPASEVTLTDSEPQRVDQRGQAFHHLTIAGGGPKSLLTEARVAGTLTLTDGMVVPQPVAPLTLETTATVAQGSESSYVESTMQYQGNGLRTFPLGLNGVYLPITLTEVVGSPTLRVSVVAPAPPATAGETIAQVSTARYWQITPTEGRFEGSRAELTVTADDALDDLRGAVVVQADQPGGIFTSVGQSARQGDARRGSVTSELPVRQAIVAIGLTSEFSLENQVLVPSAFAPAAPNPVNRLLKIYTATLLPEPFSFRVFDRWGTLVYRTTSLRQAQEEGWNGERQADRSIALPGVYQYHVEGIFEDGTPVHQTGTITLFR